MKTDKTNWEFIDENGTFRWVNPRPLNELYFPLCNEAGMMASITPVLHGDSKAGQHNFFLQPVTVEDMHNTKSARNFWVYVHGKGAWSASGNSAVQNSRRFNEVDDTQRVVEAGLLCHKITYKDGGMGLKSEILSFVPVENEKVEIMLVKITNEGSEEIRITPTSATPIYGRSAENIRDHRHVTSLVNRIERLENGMVLKPEIVFDERGHRMNDIMYYVLGSEQDGEKPIGTFPLTHSFVGDGGNYEWPEAVVRNFSPVRFEDENTDGKECAGAIRFEDCVLGKEQSKEYIIIMGICNGKEEIGRVLEKYNSSEKVLVALQKNKEFWNERASRIVFTSGEKQFLSWMKWISIQPILRKIYGCSFLPYHDYGKGGRGWRDLWQDCLSLILLNPAEVRELLVNNFAGVRVDGTNATIIGSKPGEFMADRNNISRVWMDHGSWPYLTTKQYIDQSGDFGILLEKQVYFRDPQTRRAAKKDEKWTPQYGSKLKASDDNIYEGTIIEHLLIQHLTCFFNVGEHNIIRLEGGDWNDTIDMARTRGESTAFTALYGSNLISIATLLEQLKDKLSIESLELFEESLKLLDSISSVPQYDSIEYKKTVLNSYFDAVEESVTGKKIQVKISELSADLRKKGEWIYNHIGKNEWIETSNDSGFFNGYYNNDGQRVDGEDNGEVRMNLTGQVFTTMYGLASENQVLRGYEACRKYLKDNTTGGYRLNTHLGNNKLNFGRGFAFAYGEKENGATFSHMVVMYMNALYKRGFVDEAYEVFKSMFDLCLDTQTSGIYPGIPEYFSDSGKGMYHYLTGSASWLLMTVLNEMYGVKGDSGELVIQPKLARGQFGEDGVCSVTTSFAGKKIKVEYINKSALDYKASRIHSAELNGENIDRFISDTKTLKISQNDFVDMTVGKENTIKVYFTMLDIRK